MSADIIPVIYALRSRLNETRSLEEQTEAVAEGLLQLERLYSDFDRLDIVKNAKQLLSDQLLQDSQDVNLRNHLQMRGFEPIRRTVISTQIPASTDLDLLSFKFAPSSNKKQKSGGYSMSFNFDDFPMFETVDSMLEGLRADVTDRASLKKILALDLSELIDHPQWEELLQTLHRSICIPGEHQLIVVAVYHRFVVGFKGSSQGLDAMNYALTHLVAQWTATSPPDAEAAQQFISKSQLALFCTVLQTASTSVQVPYQKEADRAVVLMFILLAKGNISCTESTISVIEALTSTSEQGDAISSLLRAVHPFTAFSYAVQTGLFSLLLNSSFSTFSSTHTSLRAAFTRVRMVLALLSCFGGNLSQVAEFVERHAYPHSHNGGVVYDDSAYAWQGEHASLMAVNIDAKGTAQLVLPIEGSNKRFLHLSHGDQLMRWFTEGPPPGTTAQQTASTHFLARWIATELSSLVSQLTQMLSEGTLSLGDLCLGDLVRLALTFCSEQTQTAALSHSTTIIHACRHILQLTEQVQSRILFGDDVLLGYISGLTVLLVGVSTEGSAGSAGSAGCSNGELSSLLLKCVDDLLNRQIFASVDSNHSAETQTAFVRLLCAYVQRPHLVSTEHLTSIVEMCVLVLQIILTATSADVHSITAESRLLLLQALQTICAESAYRDILREQKFVAPASAVLLSCLLREEFADTHSADCNVRSVLALLAVFATSSEAEVTACLLEYGEVKREILRVMESEYLDVDAWDRAQDLEQSASVPFVALFSLLEGLASMGQISVLNAICGESWGELISFEDNELSDLCALCANLCLRRDSAVILSSECVYPYILRLLYAAQQNPRFVADLRRFHEQSLPGDDSAADADGTDLTELFVQRTARLIDSSGVGVLDATHHPDHLIPRSEIELHAML